jgi:protein phosphatase
MSCDARTQLESGAKPVWIHAAGKTAAGAIRHVNEDAFWFEEDGEALALIVDGHGGIAAGVQAAEITIAACREVFARRISAYAEAWWTAEHTAPVIAWAELPVEERAVIEARVREIRVTKTPATPGDLAILENERDIVATIARRCLVEANRVMTQRASEELVLRGSGATVVCAVFGRGVVGISHVGDARCYRLRDEVLEQLTVDHSLINMLLEQQQMTPAEIEAFPHKNVITRAVGIGDSEPEVRALDTREGDRFLLCTDGIWRTVDESRLREPACEALVDEAARTSKDNVAALIVELR